MGKNLPLSGIGRGERRKRGGEPELSRKAASKMAASGLAGVADAAAVEMAMDRKSPRVHLLQLNAIFAGAFDKNTTCNGADIAKCLECLNGVLPAAGIDPYMKTNSIAHKLNGFNFGRGSFSARLGRSPSTDSIAASNFSSDLGSVDSCNYSSNGSDSNSGSSPCSPEEPDRFSRAGTPQPMPPIPPCLQEDSQLEDEYIKQQDAALLEPRQYAYDASRTDVISCEVNERVSSPELADCKKRKFSETDSKPENIKQFYLQSNLVPNSNSMSFQRVHTQDCVSTCQQSNASSFSAISNKIGSCSDSSSHSPQLLLGGKQRTPQSNLSTNSTNQSNCSSDLQHCNWHQCQLSIEGNELVEHIRSQHVQVQKDKESFVCLWEGCKVYNRASCSTSWLERHILSHAGNKPFKCIVDNCSLLFPTQAALQRHVNSHFESNSQGGKTNKCRDDTFPKSFRRKKHLKYKKRSALGRTEDFFDANVMEQIRYKLVESHSCVKSDVSISSRSITFYSRVKARRIDKSGKVNVLLEWIPENVLPDSWVTEDSIIKCKMIPVVSLPLESRVLLGLYSPNDSDEPRVKQRRK